MNYILLGTDKRFEYLGSLLRRKNLAHACPAQIAILAPRESAFRHTKELAPGAYIFSGCDSKESLEAQGYKKIVPSSTYIRKNSHATAEGALCLAISETEDILQNKQVLLLGFGALGKEVADLFSCLEMKITVCSRDDEELGIAKFSGFSTIQLSLLKNLSYPVIINTIPAAVLNPFLLNTASSNSILIELASIPCCNPEDAPFYIVPAKGLPGRFSPSYSARCIYEELLPYLS